MIPGSYLQWRHCIEVECGLVLTPEFITARLAELRDVGNERTAQFVRCYGEPHRQRIVGWFEHAAAQG